jgi:hypothetical protein
VAAASLVAVCLPGAAAADPVPVPVPLPVVGTTYHGMWGFYTEPDQTALMDKVAWTGADWIRVGVGWAGLQPRRPTATDPGLAMNGAVARLDRVVEMARTRGLDVTVTLKTTPGWANGYRPGKVLPNDPADYASIAGWVAQRYAGAVSSIEVYNEPNLQLQTVTTPEQYTRLLCPAYQAISTAAPSVKVIFGGTAGNDWEYIDAAYRAGAKGCFDVMATHPYQGFSKPPGYPAESDRRWWTHNVRLVRQAMIRHGDGSTPVWFTEVGWSTHANYPGIPPEWIGVTRVQQARYLVDMVRMTAQRWPYVERLNWYAARDERTFLPNSLENDNFGLFELDLDPKPSAFRLRRLLRG